MLVALGNPQRVTFNFIFWTATFELYKVVIGATAFGVLLTLLYTSQVKYLQRVSRMSIGRLRSRR